MANMDFLIFFIKSQKSCGLGSLKYHGTWRIFENTREKKTFIVILSYDKNDNDSDDNDDVVGNDYDNIVSDDDDCDD